MKEAGWTHSDKLCKLNESPQLHLVQHGCLCQLKRPPAPPPLFSIILRPQCLSSESRGEGMWAQCQPSLGEKTPRLPMWGSTLWGKAGYQGNQPPPPPDGGKTSFKCQLFQETKRKEAHFQSIVHEEFLYLFFKSYKRALRGIVGPSGRWNVVYQLTLSL